MGGLSSGPIHVPGPFGGQPVGGLSSGPIHVHTHAHSTDTHMYACRHPRTQECTHIHTPQIARTHTHAGILLIHRLECPSKSRNLHLDQKR